MQGQKLENYIHNVMDTHILPAIKKFIYDNLEADVQKSLWYFSDDGKVNAVMGPIKFDRLFFVGAGYSEEAISGLVGLLVKAQIEKGLVISVNFKLKGMECNQVRNMFIPGYMLGA